MLNPNIEQTAIQKKEKSKAIYNAEFKMMAKRLREIHPQCEQCGNDNYLMVHHKDKDKLNNAEDNLEVLCFDCHKIHHPHLRIPPWMSKSNVL